MRAQNRHRTRRTGRTAIIATIAAVVLAGGGVIAGVHAMARPPAGAVARPAVPAASSTGTEQPAGEGARSVDIADRDEQLSDALGAVAGATAADFSVAVLDTASGAQAVYGNGTYDTASIVKVDILAALLLRAQDAGRDLTAQEKAYATVMIEQSDNEAATALWHAVDGADGLAEANERLGLTGTVGGDGDLWGLTRTTAADQLRLLRAVFGDDPPLDAGSRAYLRGLMERISVGQDWGVTAAAETASDTALKNGWLRRTTTGRWDINSIGRVAADGNTYLVAVLSSGHLTQAAGIALAEDVAQAAVGAFR
ncbi:serine hydrolase [Streptomyces sp. H39-S7]|uniref:serine hydrolase n=1 Tax=Streptomyces sp. H39-S7 TaxID=3004357 RepID=UPI0022AF3D20|nr:serine hydrolase [Streptomyces sp. H39-S7]MCZ4118304.1 serine hydrolase [Streptomyces sp. H39-S7]